MFSKTSDGKEKTNENLLRSIGSLERLVFKLLMEIITKN